MLASTFRRFIDIAVAGSALLIVAPLLLICILLLRRDGGPAFFTQSRMGRNQENFQIVKLRTMIVDADRHLDAQGKPTTNRVTRIGAVLRKYSIDELPQFWNVLRGDMSLVGPRPILPMMAPYLTPTERMRFSVPPGLTGLAQIKGRNAMKWSKRFRYDVFYVRHRTLALDLSIISRTFGLIVRGANVAQDRNPAQVNDITTRRL